MADSAGVVALAGGKVKVFVEFGGFLAVEAPDGSVPVVDEGRVSQISSGEALMGEGEVDFALKLLLEPVV